MVQGQHKTKRCVQCLYEINAAFMSIQKGMMHSVSFWNKNMCSVFLRNTNKLHYLLLWEKEDAFNNIMKKSCIFGQSKTKCCVQCYYETKGQCYYKIKYRKKCTGNYVKGEVFSVFI